MSIDPANGILREAPGLIVVAIMAGWIEQAEPEDWRDVDRAIEEVRAVGGFDDRDAEFADLIRSVIVESQVRDGD